MTSPRIGRASLIIASGTLVSRVLGLVRAMVLVYAIGATGLAANAFATASRVPNTVYTLIATGALTAVLVPQITRAALAKDGGARYINKLITLALVGSLGITVIVAAATPALIDALSPGWDDAQIQLARVFAFWLIPQIVFYTLYTVLGEILNARSIFGPYAWSPVLNNVLNVGGLIAFVLMFGSDPDGTLSLGRWNMTAISLVAGSATLGVAAQALVLFGFWRKAELVFRLDFKWRGIGLGATGRIATWTFLTVLLNQVAGLINARVMNIPDPGDIGLAAADLASLVFVLPHSIITISLIMANFTRMSQSVQRHDMTEFKRVFAGTMRITTVAMVFFAVTMLILAAPLSRLIQPGASYDTVIAVSLVLTANLAGLVPFSLLFVLNRGFYARDDTKTPFIIAMGQVVLSLGVAFACATLPSEQITVTLMFWLQVVVALQAITTYFVLRGRIGSFGGRSITVTLGQTIGAALLAAVAGFGVLQLFGGITDGGLGVSGFGGAFVVSALVTISMGVIYLVLLVLLKNSEARDLVRRARSIIRR